MLLFLKLVFCFGIFEIHEENKCSLIKLVLKVLYLTPPSWIHTGQISVVKLHLLQVIKTYLTIKPNFFPKHLVTSCETNVLMNTFLGIIALYLLFC